MIFTIQETNYCLNGLFYFLKNKVPLVHYLVQSFLELFLKVVPKVK